MPAILRVIVCNGDDYDDIVGTLTPVVLALVQVLVLVLVLIADNSFSVATSTATATIATDVEASGYVA